MAARRRLILSQLAVGMLALLMLLTDTVWGHTSILGLLFFAVGIVFMGMGCLGRVWCYAHLAGWKDSALVTVGPYSICRNPLYLFSLLGALGVTLASCTFSLPVLVLIGFLAYYPWVIKHEERRLARRYPAEFASYRSKTPLFLPKPSLYTEPEWYEVNTRSFRRSLIDCSWFIVAFAATHLLAALHGSHLLPAWWLIP